MAKQQEVGLAIAQDFLRGVDLAQMIRRVVISSKKGQNSIDEIRYTMTPLISTVFVIHLCTEPGKRTLLP
jgi:hypothetical protein